MNLGASVGNSLGESGGGSVKTGQFPLLTAPTWKLGLRLIDNRASGL